MFTQNLLKVCVYLVQVMYYAASTQHAVLVNSFWGSRDARRKIHRYSNHDHTGDGRAKEFVLVFIPNWNH
jgi:hypothetical protein